MSLLHTVHWSGSGGHNNIDNPSENHFKPKSRKISFFYNIYFSQIIHLKFYTEHDSPAAVLGAKFQKNPSTRKVAMEKRDFARFHCKVYFGLVVYIVTRSGVRKHGGLLPHMLLNSRRVQLVSTPGINQGSVLSPCLFTHGVGQLQRQYSATGVSKINYISYIMPGYIIWIA